MKRWINYFMIALLISACKKDDGIAYNSQYQRSYMAWHIFQENSGDSYVYQRESGSWAGYSTETTITVRQGKIVERKYVRKMRTGNGPIMVASQWTEDETQLGTHPEGHEALTLEEIYKKAKSEWLLERDDASMYFETENDGMISLCGYSKKGCADDCFTGVHIAYIRAL